MTAKAAEKRTGQGAGVKPDGPPREHAVFHGTPDVRSDADLARVLAARLGGRKGPAADLLEQMLDAFAAGKDPAALAAEGKKLTPAERYAVSQVLRTWPGRADDYGWPSAHPKLTALRKAWADRWGEQPPRPVMAPSLEKVALQQQAEAEQRKRAGLAVNPF